MPTEYTSLPSRDGTRYLSDDGERCIKCRALWPRGTKHDCPEVAAERERAEFKRRELHRTHFCATCWANATLEADTLALALHAVKGGGGGFAEAGTCECPEEAAAIISEYGRLVAGKL